VLSGDLERAKRILEGMVSVVEILPYITNDPFLTIPMATAHIGHKDNRVIQRAIRKGELRHYRIGKKRILKRSEVDAWVFEHEVRPENREADKGKIIVESLSVVNVDHCGRSQPIETDATIRDFTSVQ
jgi:excisionase family DNA binding protein